MFFSKNTNWSKLQNTLIALMYQTDNVEQCSLDDLFKFRNGPRPMYR